jgi:hypothetical protein
MLKHLNNAGWIIGFLAVCAVWGSEVIRASRQSPARDMPTWICPILGKCGPAGTPGLGTWE